ncbi:hypothetical protein ACA081_00920 [Candidatus Hodgkinia cicadicola]
MDNIVNFISNRELYHDFNIKFVKRDTNLFCSTVIENLNKQTWVVILDFSFDC